MQAWEFSDTTKIMCKMISQGQNKTRKNIRITKRCIILKLGRLFL